ncbi:MAG: hypothetical protein ACI87W_000266 [Halieaceae bacterium]|jgi:hypothetical protein
MTGKDDAVTRRDVLCGALGYSALLGFSGKAAALAQPSLVSDFSDPVDAIRAHVKMVGSLAEETVVSFYRLNIYADTGSGNFVPLFTMNNLLIDKWTPHANNTYEMRKYEAGYYSPIDSYEPLVQFNNPITGAETPVVNFRLGPVPRRYTPDRFYVMAYDPNPLPLEVIGDRVFLATQSIESSPMPGGGENAPTMYTNSFMTFSAQLADVQNPGMASVPAHAQLQNKNAYTPWMKMGNTPGGTVVRGYGTKVASLDNLPRGVLEGFRKHIPEILDTDSWTTFVSEMTEAG